ncbi:phosphorylase b kinase regulatory subunit beta [Biomphalaria pfeifferi]|uniref:Phosphorylase b kinase regulatory subunit n=3 Tax=Biomphalaria pfeifferi TaxID=112525 RepID=A0AAD8C445_BIOPF|nr:phosphorylase b kinase regulatory subunit beta [Biomphalaria pfeifferi]
MPVGMARAALRQSMNVTYLVSMEPPGLGFLLILMPTTGTEQYLKLSYPGNQTLRWPALVINEDEVRKKTIEKVIRKLKGNFGIKHFPKDRYKTAIEDENRKYYRSAKIKFISTVRLSDLLASFYIALKTETATQSALNSQEYSKLPAPSYVDLTKSKLPRRVE